MDAFYAAVEQHDDPALRGKAVVVGATSARGVVLTASYEARRYGVHSAMPGHEARRLCSDCAFVRPRMARYGEVSRVIRRVFHEFTPLVEPLSFDEAFLDITGSLTLFGSAFDVGRRLKARVREETGLAVSVGIAPTKMVAKIASDVSKPDGLLEVRPEQMEAFLRPLPVGRLWGVGPALQHRLTGLGIQTIGDLVAADRSMLQRRLGSSGSALQDLGRGEDTRRVNPDRARKLYGEERTFERDLRDGDEIRGVLAEQAESLARRLRKEGRTARTVTLKLKLARALAPGKYPVLTRSATLPAAVDDGKRIRDAALELWRTSHEKRRVRLIGIAVSSIDEPAAPQLSLFESRNRQRETSLNQAVDRLADRFGAGIIKRGPP